MHEYPFFGHVFGSQEGYAGLFSGERPEQARPGEPNKGRLQHVNNHFVEYPDREHDVLRYAKEHSSMGRNVYICAHLLTEKARKKENAGLISCLWVDGDSGVPDGGVPRPTLIVESSPNKNHLYWKLTTQVQPHEAEGLNRRLASVCGGDDSGWDLTQLLRLPGTKNHDYAGVYRTVPTVRITEMRNEPWSPEYLDSVLPPLPVEPVRAAPKPPVVENSPSSVDREDPAATQLKPYPDVVKRLGTHGRRVFEGKYPVYKADGEVDRSASLYKIACVLCEALRPSLLEGEIESSVPKVLEERDRSLGWDKYLDRPSEYRRMVKNNLSKDGDR